MTVTRFVQWTCFAMLCSNAFYTHANSIGLEFEDFSGTDGIFSFTVIYDFSDFAMFGGGANLIYDETTLEFVSYEQAPLPADAQAPVSPIGALDSPGSYVGLGIGTLDFINGMNSAGVIGTFYFNIVGTPSGFSGCGGTQDPYMDPVLNYACLTPNATNPLVSLAGDDVTVEVFLAGNGTYVMPVPAAIWCFLGGVSVLFGLRKKRRT